MLDLDKVRNKSIRSYSGAITSILEVFPNITIGLIRPSFIVVHSNCATEILSEKELSNRLDELNFNWRDCNEK